MLLMKVGNWGSGVVGCSDSVSRGILLGLLYAERVQTQHVSQYRNTRQWIPIRVNRHAVVCC
jgi:hypothetical protein